MLIDLDVAPPPVPPRSRRPPWRPIRVAVAAAVLLLLGGATVAPRQVVFPEVAGTGGRSVSDSLVTPEALYTVFDATGDDSVEVVAQPLVAGGPSWQVEAPLLAADSLSLSRIGSVLVVQDEVTVKILDVATGRDRWSAGDATALVLGDGVLIRDDDGEVRFADVETGTVRWRQRTDVIEAHADASGRYLFLIGTDLTVQVRSAADGRLLARRAMGEALEESIPVLAGDRVYLLGASTVTALRLTDLTTVWTARPLVMHPTEVVPCGAVLCVRGQSGISALDPATGALRWTAPGWVGLSGGVAQRSDGRNAVLDPETGTVVRHLGPGRVAGDLMLRLDGDRTQVTDLRTGRLYGTLPDVVPYGCTAAGEFLACRKSGGVTVWRIIRTAS
ncbi:hypothetical protein Acy02nite_10530 [Actinoplanes cyaneus]|uniref:Pyrrolo-quinoline quinone repeat domain-containing protein n=1 Tax=Actinoplanes cyaneus TaxID=52696 RepID=A0A919M272_9ACTN|nr:PQQ-binding-like beta-propeller repeat protein [Actinoplanes cyaneus]MCW2137121.1 outer membrane protein assembly factor BamB [Actinoplanes cyaneus]GID63172.1 hypothetical protein Acy02nite_10530 [Actinoplanes cyaneus]